MGSEKVKSGKIKIKIIIYKGRMYACWNWRNTLDEMKAKK
jgi:hypothetical protein